MSLELPALERVEKRGAHARLRAQPQAASWIDRFGLSAILVGFVLMGVWYSLAVPPFETPDEVYHYAFARHLAQGNPLPVQDAQATGPWQQEGSQAPLYYWVVGRLTAWIDQSDFDQVAVFNPRSNMGDPLYPGNKNRMLYSAADRPLTGTNLALHVARWFSVALGAWTVWCTAQTARLVVGANARLALLPPLVLATIPQFVFISASCSNDNMVIAVSATTILWLARLLRRDPATAVAWWEWGVLGVLLGLAGLSKLQGLGLWALAAGVGLAMAWLRRDRWLPLRALLPVALPALAIAGWWYWRNVTLYGDWTGLAHLISINGRRAEPLEWDEFWLEFRGLRYSFWGLFGWFNLLLPNWVYLVLDGVTLLGVAGWAAALWQGRHDGGPQRVRLLLTAWAIFSALLVIYFTTIALGSQGRLFFPAISAAVILLVIGLEQGWGRLSRRAASSLRLALPGLLVACTIYAGAVIFPASYAAPRPVAALPETAQPVDLTFGDDEVIELLAVDPPSGRYYPGEWVPVTLYLRAPAALQQNYELFIQLLDERGEVVGNVTTHPGWGRNPTRLWQPGAIYADGYQVQVRQRIDARSPLLARLYTGFVDPTSDDLSPLAARNAAGEVVTPFVASVALLPFSPAQAVDYTLEPLTVRFGDGLALMGVQMPATVQAGETLSVTMLWEATEPLSTDLTAFVHLLGANSAPLAGYDQSPGGDRYPTHAWLAGDRVVQTMTLAVPEDAPPGVYTAWVGVYPAHSGGAERLPVTEAGGRQRAHQMVRLGDVRVGGE